MQAWQQFLTALESDLGADTVNKWLRPLKVVHFDAGNLYLEASDSFQIAWFEEHIRTKARKALVNNNYNPIKIHLSSSSMDTPVKASPVKGSPFPIKAPFTLQVDTLDPLATLDNFIVTESSLLVFDLVASLSGFTKDSTHPTALGQFNPIYIHGASGSGKSHLLMGIAHSLAQNSISACYVKMETFTENVVAAIRSGNMQEFRKAYRMADVLIVDDVQILAKKLATQEEFFHTFNTLQTVGKQIILSANCSPAFLQDIEPRLVSRFEWGITLQIGMLEQDDLIKMLEKRLELLSFPLSKSALEYLVETFSFHLKSLHRAIEALILRTHSGNTKILSQHLGAKDIEVLLSDLIEQTRRQVLNPQKIVQSVAEFYGIKSEDILGKSQSHEYTLPRKIAMYLCRQKIKMPFTQIGQFFHRDHSTVMSSVSHIKETDDVELTASLKMLGKKLESLADAS
ncbi:MAG: DnaA/Hda family protein [Chlamydiae bacterium]|nr:DnaA/Hda family protein [Chlamydiota bacterium]